MAEYDEFGREVPDSTPVEVPLNLRGRVSFHDEMRRFIRVEMSRQAAEAGQESFEEADDFEVDDEDLQFSQYELTEMQEESRMPTDRDGPDLEKGNVGKVDERGKGNGTGKSAERSGGDEAAAGKDVESGVSAGDRPGREDARGPG